MSKYTKGTHTTYHHRYHLVWITKYRYKVLTGSIQIRARDLLSKISEQEGVKIINGVISKDHVHIFCSIPPHKKVSTYVQKMKGLSSSKLRNEYPELRKKYWGRHFWGRGYFSTTSGNITDEMINEYIDNHLDAHSNENIENIRLD